MNPASEAVLRRLAGATEVINNPHGITVTKCPPHHNSKLEITHKPWQYGGARMVTKASRISWQDKERMHTVRKRREFYRSLPEWATDDVKVRQVVLRYVEMRYFMSAAIGGKKHVEAPVQEQLALIRKEELFCADKLEEKLDRLLGTKLDLPHIEQAIQIADTAIVVNRRGMAALAAAVAYSYYRLGLSSVDIGRQFGIRSPHVRIILYRLNRAWRDIQGVKRPPLPKRYKARGAKEHCEVPSQAEREEGRLGSAAFATLTGCEAGF